GGLARRGGWSGRAGRAVVDARAPEFDDERRTAVGRVAAGRLDRLDRLLDPNEVSRRDVLIEQARAVYLEEAFDPGAAAAVLVENARARGDDAREKEEVKISGLDLPAREAEQRLRRAQRGAEREELLAQLEELASWYRDLVAVNVRAERAAMPVDRPAELPARAAPPR